MTQSGAWLEHTSSAPRRTPRHAEGGWHPLAGWLGVGALTLASALVFWLFDALPFQDLPAHAGLIALRHRIAGSPFDRRFFVFAPHLGPYSLFRFLGECLVVPLGPVRAIRAIATLPIVLTPLAVVWARKRLHGDGLATSAFFALSLGFGFMTLLGFASFLLGIAVVLVAVTMWLELLVAVDRRDPTTLRRELVISGFAPFVLVAHGHAFVLFVAIACVSAVSTGDRARRCVRVRTLTPALALAAWITWQERSSAVPNGSVALPSTTLAPHFQGAFDKLSLLVTPTLMTRTGVDVLVGLGVWALVIAALVATARGLGWPAAPNRLAGKDDASRVHAFALLTSVSALALAFLVLPHSVGWFGFVDGRLVPLLLLLGIMAVRRPSLGRRLSTAFDAGGAVAACVMVTTAMVASHRFQAEAVGFREVLAAVPAHAKLLNLPLEPDSDVFTAHPFVHYDKLILADRDAVVSDLWFHQGSAVYPTAENPTLRLPKNYSESDLRAIDWPTYRLEDWDYVLIRTRPRAHEPWVPPSLRLAFHRGGWWLFRTGGRGERERPEFDQPE